MGLHMQKVQIMMGVDVYSLNMGVVQMERILRKGQDFMVRKYLPDSFLNYCPGCPESCAQSKYGCCPDGQTASRGPNKEGCPCQYSRWGCCKDGQTTAIGPHEEGCDDCRYGK